MLRIQGLTKFYAGNNIPAVDNLCLEVRKGEIFGFLGPNGAGKSTTIKLITGILKPDNGIIIVDGKELSANMQEVKKKIGYVSDNHATYERLTGFEYLAFIGSVFGVDKNDIKERALRYGEMFGLSNALNSQISTYSHGMKQKIAIMAALVHEPDLWILDEPLTGLDPQSAYDLKRMMREYANQGKTVFFSSHVIEVVERLCDRVGIINHGRLTAVASVEDLKVRFPDKSLEEIFLMLTA